LGIGFAEHHPKHPVAFYAEELKPIPEKNVEWGAEIRKNRNLPRIQKVAEVGTLGRRMGVAILQSKRVPDGTAIPKLG
jgi:hypothetical protein